MPSSTPRLARTWGTTASLIGRLSTVDHKIVGRRYLLTALAFLLLGGALAAVMRLQLARPESQLVGPDLYNQLFTMHGTTMMFLFAVPVAEAFAVYLVPLMVGTRNIAFPRLNAFSYWMYLFGGICPVVRLRAEHRPRCRLVRLRALGRPAIRHRQARRRLGADDHLHRGVRAWRWRSRSSSPSSSSAPRA